VEGYLGAGERSSCVVPGLLRRIVCCGLVLIIDREGKTEKKI
jgi:hypothetical protein